ncbi:MAG: hypothetical protein WDM80_08065 [Limisphaerales bacterium]
MATLLGFWQFLPRAARHQLYEQFFNAITRKKKSVLNWVGEMSALCQPDKIHWCDGSETEKEALTAEAVAKVF